MTGRILPRALAAITFGLNIYAQKVIPFWESHEIGYLIVLKRKPGATVYLSLPPPPGIMYIKDDQYYFCKFFFLAMQGVYKDKF